MKHFRGTLTMAASLIIGVAVGSTVFADDAQRGTRGTAWVAAGMEDSLTAVDVATGEVVASLPVGVNPHILSVSPDGRTLYVINAGEHDREPHSESDVAGPGESMATGGPAMGSTAAGHMERERDKELAGNSLWAVDGATGRIIARVPVGLGPTHPLASPDGRFVYVTNTDENTVSVIDTRTWTVVATVGGLPEPHDAAITPDGRLLYVATSESSTLSIVDTVRRSVVASFGVGTKPRGVAVGGAEGETAYVTNKADGTMTILDVPSGTVRGTFEVGRGAHALRVAPDGRTIYIALSQENAVAVFDTETTTVVRKIPVGTTPEQIDLSADGTLLFAANNGDATMTIIRTSDQKRVTTVPVGAGAYGVQMVTIGLKATDSDHSTSRMGR